MDVATGERQPWLELTPPDPAGVQSIGPVHMSADGKAYVYSYRRKLDQLFVVEGLRRRRPVGRATGQPLADLAKPGAEAIVEPSAVASRSRGAGAPPIRAGTR